MRAPYLPRTPTIIPSGSGGGGFTPSESPLLSALGLKRVNYDPHLPQSGATPTSQVIYAMDLATVAGETYTGVVLWLNQAAVGTTPTGFFAGLATQAPTGSPGTMLAQSANLAASAALTTLGMQQFPFSAPYVETVTGLRAVLALMNGTFGTTQPLILRMPNVAPSAPSVSFYKSIAAQTGFPANGNALPNYTVAAPLGFWVGLY